ncbi:DUF3164 family protein [Methylobacter marinus]|uniref:DUF3164 family protein n=1 Tax=Methylobacter marinus TaxID=34058 RepID=UPI000369C8B2|nr:DUF3164 family protein [Methylobacter marinus]
MSTKQLNTPFPPGYRADSYGRLVPVSAIQPLDLLRDDTVATIIDKARSVQAQMKNFKRQAMDDIAAFLAIAAEQYQTTLGGKKGNLSLVSYDGKYKVIVAVSDSLNFDERLHIAKQLIDECIHEWTADSNANIKALVEHAFQTDKQGNINTARIFGLMRLKIEDAKWRQAMEALKDSIQITATSQYLRLYERVGESDKYQQIAMDIAGL